jgi:hypothetical protein
MRRLSAIQLNCFVPLVTGNDVSTRRGLPDGIGKTQNSGLLSDEKIAAPRLEASGEN